ncbi:MAG: UPF0149 family protein [Burkholderiales bacterium]
MASESPPEHLWSDADAAALEHALAPRAADDGALGYCELAGFLFAVACAPELVEPSEWLPAVLGEAADAPDAQDLALLMRLYNAINDGADRRDPALPAGIAARDRVLQNFAPDAPLCRWSRGYAEGQDWLKDTWEALLPAAADGEDDPDEVLGALMTVLAFFGDRGFAEDMHHQSRSTAPFREFAAQMLESHPNAMLDLAILGRNIAEARALAARGPAKSSKVGRNAPCPCGSGKKFKACCGANA